MYDIDTMLNFSRHAQIAVCKTDGAVAMDEGTAQKIIDDKVILWPLYRTQASDVNTAIAETLRFQCGKLFEARAKIHKASAYLKTLFSPIVIFPLQIEKQKWVVAKLSLTENTIQLTLVDLLGVLNRAPSDFKQLMPHDLIEAQKLVSDVTYDAINSSVKLKPEYSGAIVLYLLRRYLTEANPLILTEVINEIWIQAVINDHMIELLAEQQVAPTVIQAASTHKEKLPAGIVDAYGFSINLNYQYTEDNVLAALRAALTASSLTINATGAIINADGTAYRSNNFLMAVTGALQVGGTKVEMNTKLLAFVDIVQALLAANASPEQYVFCFPISINHNHWSAGTFTIETKPTDDTRVISGAMLTVHDTLYTPEAAGNYGVAIFKSIIEKLRQRSLVKENATEHLSAVPANRQPDGTSCGVLTVAALESCILRRPLPLNGAYTREDVTTLRAQHLALLSTTDFPKEQLDNLQDVRLQEKPKTSSLVNDDAVAELKAYLLRLSLDARNDFEQIAKEFLEAKTIQDWHDNNDENSFAKLKLLNIGLSDEELLIKITSVENLEAALRTATTNIKNWFKQQMDQKLSFHNILFSDKLDEDGELTWNTQSSTDMRSVLLAMLETIYIPMPAAKPKPKAQREFHLDHRDDEEMSDESDGVIKDQHVMIDGYTFHGELNCDYTFFHGTEKITINGNVFTYEGDFEHCHRAIAGGEENPVPELGISTNFCGEYNHTTGAMEFGDILCVVGGKLDFPKQSAEEADLYVLYEGSISDGYADGDGELYLASLDSNNAPCRTLIYKGTFKDGLSDIDPQKIEEIEKDPRLKAACQHYMQNIADLRMHINPQTEKTINTLRRAAEISIEPPKLVAPQPTSTFTPYFKARNQRTDSAESGFFATSEQPTAVAEEVDDLDELVYGPTTTKPTKTRHLSRRGVFDF